MADGYWKSVFAGAWGKTYQPLGWDRKKVAVALVALGAIIAAGFHLGLAAMITTATGYLWIAAPAVFAAIVLFAWGVVETQAKLYGDLMQTASASISTLEAKIAKHENKFKKPNYTAVRLQHRYTLGDASKLWIDISPNAPANSESKAWFDTFKSAVQQRQLKFIPNWPGDRDMIDYERQNPRWETFISREEFQRFAKSINEDPPFLRDS
jgi:hypothetical protein